MLNGGLGLGMMFYAKDMMSGTMLNLEKRWQSLDGTVERGVQNISRSWDRLKQGSAAFAGGAVIAGSLGAVGKSAFRAAAQMETYTTSFTTLLGSADAAQAHLAELQQFAADTPFEFDGLVDASKRLQAYGFAAEDIIPTLTQVGDAAAALGGGAETQNRLIRALGQIRAKGKLAMQEVLQIGETGAPIFEILQEELGLTAEQVGDIGRQGLAASKAIPAILAGLEKRYQGEMEAQSKTALGMLANIGDAMKGIKLDIGGAYLESVKGAIADVKRVMESLNASDALKGLGQGLGDLVNLIWPIARGILTVVQGIGDMVAKKPYILELVTMFAGIVGVTAMIVGGMVALRSSLAIVTFLLKAAGLSGVYGWGAMLGPIAAVSGAVMGLVVAYRTNLRGFKDFVDRAKMVWDGFWALLSSARMTADGLVGSMPEELYQRLQKAGLLPWVTGLFQAFTRLRSFALGVAQGIGAAWDVAMVPIRWAIEGIQSAVEFLGVILARLGLDVMKVGNAPGSSSWQSFGRVVGKVLAGLLAPLGLVKVVTVSIKGVSAFLGGLRAIGGAAKGTWGALKTIGGWLAPSRSLGLLKDAFSEVYLRALYAKDAIHGAWRRFSAFPTSTVKVARGAFETLQLKAMYLGESLHGAWSNVAAWSMTKLTAAKASLVSLRGSAVGLSKGLFATAKSWLAAGVAGLKAGLMWLASPVGLITLGIVALVAGLVLLVKHWDKVKAAVASVWKRFTSFATDMPGWAAGLLAIFAPIIGIPVLLIRNWDSITQWFKDLPGKVRSGIAPLGDVVLSIGGWFLKLPGIIWGAVKQIPGLIWDALVGLKDMVIDAFKGLGGQIVASLTDGIKGAAKWGLDKLGAIGDWFSGLFGGSTEVKAPSGGATSWPGWGFNPVPQVAVAGGYGYVVNTTAIPASPVPAAPVTFPKAPAANQSAAQTAAQGKQTQPVPYQQPVLPTTTGTTLIQLVVGQRVLAETVANQQNEDARRQGTW